jgi:putative sigma-54 modulation protein
MNVTTKAIGFSLEQDEQDLITRKLVRIHYAEDLIVDLALSVKEDKKFIFECTVNFRWGTVSHITAEDYEFASALNKLMDVLDLKIKKEKDKVQDKK